MEAVGHFFKAFGQFYADVLMKLADPLPNPEMVMGFKGSLLKMGDDFIAAAQYKSLVGRVMQELIANCNVKVAEFDAALCPSCGRFVSNKDGDCPTCGGKLIRQAI